MHTTRVFAATALLALLALAGCRPESTGASQQAQIQAGEELRVGTLYHPLYYFLRNEREEGWTMSWHGALPTTWASS
ncbi:hypothetical protein MBH78_16860 [Oceanimonas sp. NS1]|nr:hypothetical protein [Oceanimonas sp. NS1]